MAWRTSTAASQSPSSCGETGKGWRGGWVQIKRPLLSSHTPPPLNLYQSAVLRLGSLSLLYIWCYDCRLGPCRDLKLDNVVVRERVGCRPTYELADLGESKFVPAEAAARHTVGVGATLYMAPEMRPVSGGARRGVQLSPRYLLVSSLFPVPCMLPVELKYRVGSCCPLPLALRKQVGPTLHRCSIGLVG